MLVARHVVVAMLTLLNQDIRFTFSSCIHRQATPPVREIWVAMLAVIWLSFACLLHFSVMHTIIYPSFIKSHDCKIGSIVALWVSHLSSMITIGKYFPPTFRPLATDIMFFEIILSSLCPIKRFGCINAAQCGIKEVTHTDLVQRYPGRTFSRPPSMYIHISCATIHYNREPFCWLCFWYGLESDWGDLLVAINIDWTRVSVLREHGCITRLIFTYTMCVSSTSLEHCFGLGVMMLKGASDNWCDLWRDLWHDLWQSISIALRFLFWVSTVA